MAKLSHDERLYKRYMAQMTIYFAEGRITAKYLEKDLKRYRKAYGIKDRGEF